MEATDEMIAMARRIASEKWPSSHDFAEYYAAEDAALAAIIETTERAAKCADILIQRRAIEQGWTGTDTNEVAVALRAADHLKGPDNAQ